MTNIPIRALCAALLWATTLVASAEGMVTILSPADGARLNALDDNVISYRIVPGPRGDHVHLYDNGNEIAVIRSLEGSYPLTSVGMGAREICIKVVNRAHVPIGIEGCVKVVIE
ncbi:MAG: hypothetical protein OQK94_02930 [Gammaproteobacteria bacterium]|nr:hypothetical protein [Gammaproteobacteria bacterium]MCW8839727.1 hypothetical protein [Gammaproteobacteria bacterium]MCW8959088.1 hypothetical protein [Gammaproteobacteria bacterium]MCW8994155.1 hypothetical protein [Gammaproteobacteria bacterium]